ncbi:hypothetical protein DM01DRAFT_1337971 [Hesseltinella vesiculosa]|uniref:Uncharacterized protein n=1 Tax=Hesseltinella vesiculosa TaxID=101127 RepID=A0A1X2GBF8_9FUNG|nr:hypothetical protein DM01DRAFT_1337971 [Hesseltinella vesiculosa]
MHKVDTSLQPRLDCIAAFGAGVAAASWIVMVWVISDAFHVPFQRSLGVPGGWITMTKSS